ncbi:hypothetical protein [Paenibacillus campinasensis]|uniref:Uncharacterized protein n=1 Tax=Paenibacillus campinasensis TaxID=66347 RepID=A0A268EKS0_9BACL|nr:hypothetical protein [Paenibacillus campinasensis]PAD73694.1 hypothetical protein CHH67_19865 [Paenibacillus campinasensis]
MTTNIRPKGVMIPRENEGMYIKLIEKYSLTFALTFTKIVDCDPDFSLEEKIEASKIYLSEVGDILVRNFVHCEGHGLEVHSGYEKEMGFYIQAECQHCHGFDSHFSVSPGTKGGSPVHNTSSGWGEGLKRKGVPHL